MLSAVLSAMLVVGMVSGLGDARSASGAQVATDDAPVLSLLAAADKIDTQLNHLRAAFVVKIPTGYVNTSGVVGSSGKLKPDSQNRYLRLAYDRGGLGSGTTTLRYANIMMADPVANGPLGWANNKTDYWTIHRVVTVGQDDYLLVSVATSLALTVKSGADVVRGGTPEWLNIYMGYSTGSGSMPDVDPQNASWFTQAQTVYRLDYKKYGYQAGVDAKHRIQGPIVQMQKDPVFWSSGWANWSAWLDYGYKESSTKWPNTSAGILPTNSMAVELVNNAFQTKDKGPRGSVSDSFWYAWVNHDGSLVTSLNTAPIHIDGVAPSAGPRSSAMVKNVKVAAGQPTLAWTADAAAQGLTDKVKADGTIDFNGAGGSGYYRLMVWPEAHDPGTVTNESVPAEELSISYSADDLFAGGMMTERARQSAWTAGSVLYQFDFPTALAPPPPPVIEKPEDGSVSDVNTSVTISGTGKPGHSITLKFTPGSSIADPNAQSLETIVDGGLACIPTGCEVIVRADGTWSYEYTPAQPLPDGDYTVVAFQTDHGSGATSGPSNPDVASAPTTWGVTFTIDTTPPTVRVRGDKIVRGVEHSPADVVLPGASNWDITAAADGRSWVLNSGEDVELERGVTYAIGEQTRAGAPSEAATQLYTQKGQPSCVDGEGVPLPGGVFDPAQSTLTIGIDDEIREPVTCTVENQAAVVGLVTKRVGGQTTAPSASWSLAATNGTTTFDFALSGGDSAVVVRPSSYDLTASTPDGVSLLGVEKLDLSAEDCRAAASAPLTAPERCWKSIGGAKVIDTVEQGQANIYRVVGVMPADLPSLPVTGGMGSWIFTVAGAGAGLLALCGWLLRRRRESTR